MSINGMLSAHGVLRHLDGNLRSQSSAMQKLSSGLRINTGADDPAGLTISEQLRSQIAGLERAIQNSSEADDVLSITEGALGTMQSVLTNMRKLAVSAGNSGVLDPERMAALQAEMDSSLQSLANIMDTTNVAGRKLLDHLRDDGKLPLPDHPIEPGPGDGDVPPEIVDDAANGSRWAGELLRDAENPAALPGGEGEDAVPFQNPDGDGPPGDAEGGNVLEFAKSPMTLDDKANSGESLEDQLRRLSERDRALLDAGNSLDNLGMTSIGKITVPGDGYQPVTYTLEDLYSGGKASLATDSAMAMRIVEQAGKDVASERAKIGATINLNANNRAAMEAQLENTTRMESGIRDTDMAKTMTEYARAELLSQAGYRMLDAVMEQNESVIQLLA